MKIGDKVIINDPQHRGKKGTVKRIESADSPTSGCPTRCGILVTGAMWELLWIQENLLEKITRTRSAKSA